MEPFLDDPGTIAAASTTRVTPVEELGGAAGEPELPATLFARLQVVEHLREPLFGRLGWARLNGALAVSGTAILFRKDAVVDAGGFRTQVIAEEMELVARLHRVQRGARRALPHRRGARARSAAWPRPRSLGSLREQRMRWQVALAEALEHNRGLIGNRGFAARAAYPFFFLFECLGPAIEVLAYLLMTAMFLLGLIPGMAVRGVPRVRLLARLHGLDEHVAARGDLVPPLPALGAGGAPRASPRSSRTSAIASSWRSGASTRCFDGGSR